MIYEPTPIGRVCRKCKQWKPRAELVKDKRQSYGVEQHCKVCENARRRASPSKYKRFERTRLYNLNHPDRRKKASQTYSFSHRDEHRSYQEKHRAKRLNHPVAFTSQDLKHAIVYWHGVCAYCGNPPSLFDKHRILDQDHYIPLDPGYVLVGDNPGTVPTNILPACQRCNRSKQNKNPQQWLIKRFGKRKAANILKRIEEYFESLS